MLSATLTFAYEGDMMSIKSHGVPFRGGGRRGVIQGFSKSSASRLKKLIASLKVSQLPKFLTLTYPEHYVEQVQAKEHLNTLFKRMRRAFPDVGMIWKLEFQERGAPHFHMLIYNAFGMNYEWVARAWYEIVSSGDENHLKWHLGLLPRTKPCLQEVRSIHGVRSYAGKYLAKLPDVDQETGEVHTGRIWGVKGQIPLSELFQVRVSYAVARTFRRALQRVKGVHPSGRLGIWCYGFTHNLMVAALQMDMQEADGLFLSRQVPWWCKDTPKQEAFYLEEHDQEIDHFIHQFNQELDKEYIKCY